MELNKIKNTRNSLKNTIESAKELSSEYIANLTNQTLTQKQLKELNTACDILLRLYDAWELLEQLKKIEKNKPKGSE